MTASQHEPGEEDVVPPEPVVVVVLAVVGSTVGSVVVGPASVGPGSGAGVAVTTGGDSPVQPTQMARIPSSPVMVMVAVPSPDTDTLVEQLSMMLQYSPAGRPDSLTVMIISLFTCLNSFREAGPL